MCQAIKDMIADGVQQGLEQGLYKQRQMLVNNVENAMKNFHVDLDGTAGTRKNRNELVQNAGTPAEREELEETAVRQK